MAEETQVLLGGPLVFRLGQKTQQKLSDQGRAQAFAAQKQVEIQNARAAGLTDISLRGFCNEHKQLVNSA